MKALGIALAALTAAGLGVWTALQWREPPIELQAGVLLPEPRPLDAFQLTDQNGAAFTNDDLAGNWSLLFVGFTHCPDVCPTTLSLMKLLQQRLQAQQRGLRTVFLSVDPERDTPQRLKSYVTYFSPDMVGVTGPVDVLDRLCADLGIAYVKVPGASESEYSIDHSSALVLIDPRGRVAGYFQGPLKLDLLAADLAHVIPAAS